MINIPHDAPHGTPVSHWEDYQPARSHTGSPVSASESHLIIYKSLVILGLFPQSHPLPELANSSY